MGHKLAIDFGTTNSVVALWDGGKEETTVIKVPTLGAEPAEERPSVVPSLVYVNDGAAGTVTCGQQVRDQGFDHQQDNRLYRNFKRGIAAMPAPESRLIDGVLWTDAAAGRSFVHNLIKSLPYALSDIDQLVLTAPVASFEGYLNWLSEVIKDIAPEKVRIVDESTAAALGYAVTKPGALVMVFDFGGGTLDLSLVQLPESREKTGGFLARLKKDSAKQFTASVIAKAGHIIGGSDIDHWIAHAMLKRMGIDKATAGDSYGPLLTVCEEAKIRLSSLETTEIHCVIAGTAQTLTLTRTELEALLEENGFFAALRRVVDKMMHTARQRGIFKEDIHYVLMVGGTSLMPSVQRTLGEYFTDMAVRADKPFTAVAEGALQVAAGFGLQDYLLHTYGIRHLTENGAHTYDEIIPMGSTYPTPPDRPVEIVLSAAHPNQTEIEFVIGEIDAESFSMIEVEFEDGQPVFVAQAASGERKFNPLNAHEPLRLKLEPPGIPGEERLQALFTIDDARKLRLSVVDLKTAASLLYDAPLMTLR